MESDPQKVVVNYSEVEEDELRQIGAKKNDDRWALCLSGGGIRSATFSLGVLQGLAANGWLERFHYLSTVSGGGYIGSWLSSWMARTSPQTVLTELRATSMPSSPEPVPVARLRSYSNYLSPVGGFSTDFFTLVSIFLRNLLLNWLVFIPLLAATVLFPSVYMSALVWVADFEWWELFLMAELAVLTLVIGIAYTMADLPEDVATSSPTPGAPPPSQRKKLLTPADQFALKCFAPIALAALLLSWIGYRAGQQNTWRLWHFALGGALAHLVGCVSGLNWRSSRGLAPKSGGHALSDGLFIVAAGAIGGAVVYCLSQLTGWLASGSNSAQLYATVALPALIFVFWLITTVYVAFVRRVTTEMDREWWARSGAWWLRLSIAWLAGFVLVIYGPRGVADLIPWENIGPKSVVTGSGALGIVTSLIGYFSHSATQLKERAETLAARVGVNLLELSAIVFIILLIVGMSYVMGETAISLEGRLAWPRGIATLALFVALIVFGAGMSAFVGANTFSLHSMYGNRLVRAYLGASNSQRHPHWFTGFDPGDNVYMSELKTRICKPLHIVNIALNLVKVSDSRLEWQQRKAASFTVSPLHSGSAELGYARSESYAGENGISLARAMTISGAAASPNMGYHSAAPVAFVMSLFNVRLGWWLPNPGRAGLSVRQESEPETNLVPLLTEALADTAGTTKYVYLSDGGHFENLGLYEMVRRRCRHIVVVDATCDWKFEFGDLEDAIRKIRVDLGISIEFPHGLPDPKAAPRVRKHYALGIVNYADVDGKNEQSGHICYIKPVLCGDEPLDVRRYAGQHAGKTGAFPHQSTVDQFFNEAQFESYRMLGRKSVDRLLDRMWDEEVVWSEPQQTESGTTTEPDSPAVPGPTVPERNAANALSSLGQGALIASAISVGGVLGVTGTVALKDNTLRLAPGSVVALDATDRKAAVFQFEIPAGSFSPGLYTCQINIIDAAAGKFAFPRLAFYVR